MADYNCSACSELREDAPHFINYGLTDTEVTSLKNNTGLNPSSGNDDCTDLNNMNDCLIGNMETEIDAYEVCDWKTFMKKHIANLWTVLKGIIASICGLWTKMESVESSQTDMCKLIDQMANPSLSAYGILPLADTAASQARRCGTATNKVIKMPDDGSLNVYTKAAQNIGIAYTSMTLTGCASGKREMLEWIAPSHYYYKLASGAVSGDILWKISKAEAQSKIGISDYLWDIFVRSSWTWYESTLSPSRQVAWIQITVGEHGLGEDELGVVFLGCSAPNAAITADQQFSSFNNASAKLYRHVI